MHARRTTNHQVVRTYLSTERRFSDGFLAIRVGGSHERSGRCDRLEATQPMVFRRGAGVDALLAIELIVPASRQSMALTKAAMRSRDTVIGPEQTLALILNTLR
jgi:hypothetical protein